jgi:hypothetical protein
MGAPARERGQGTRGSLPSQSGLYLDEYIAAAGIAGTYESSGKHHWRTQHVFQGSDGSSGVTEGEIDLATRSWTGEYFEKA